MKRAAMQVDNYLFEPPAEWEAQTNILLREPAVEKGAFRLNIQIGSRAAHPGLTLQVVGMTQAKTLARDLKQATIAHQGLEEQGGREVYRLAYGFEIDGNAMMQIQLFCAVADRLVSLTGTATESRAEELAEKMDGLLATLAPVKA